MLFPASKLGDIIIGIDAHTIILPVGPPVPLVPHPFVGPIFVWWTPKFPSFNVFVNGLPALTVGAKSISFHVPTPPGVWWPKLPCPAKFFITHYTTLLLSTLFSTVLGTVGAMTGTAVPTTRTPNSDMHPPPDNPSLWSALQGQVTSFTWMSLLRMLLPPVVLPIAEGDVNMASPTVTVNGGPMSFVGPLFAGSCSEIPVIPNANILGFSNVMVGVTLQEILMQLAWNVVHGVANLAAFKLGAKFGSWVSGEPVDMVSGSVYVKQTDFTIPGPIPVEFTRSYINCVNEYGPLGYNWTHNYNQFLKIENEAIFYYNEQGRPVRFPLLAVGGMFENQAESLQLTCVDTDTYRLRCRGKRTLVFRLTTLEPIARLVEIADVNGNTVRLEYTGARLVRLIDSLRRIFTFTHDTYGRLKEVRFSGRDGRVADWRLVSFEYDQRGDLSAVFDRGNQARRFSYDEHHWLTRHTNRNGFSVQYEYDGQGMCTRTSADDGKYGGTAEYLTGSRITRWTNTRNHTWTYFYNEQNLVTQILDPLGYAKKMAWSKRGQLLSITDQAGNVTAYEYDERGNIVKKTDALGGITAQKFNEFGDEEEYTDPGGISVKREFDALGRSIAFIEELGRRWEHEIAPQGYIRRTTAPDGTFRARAYDETWSSMELSDQDGVYWREEYGLLGELIAKVNTRGVRYEYKYTPQGFLQDIVGPQGICGHYEYDAEGNAISLTNAKGETSKLAYRGLNRPVAVETANQHSRFYSYEPVEEQLDSITDAEGQKIRFYFDACERLQRQEYFDGRWAECTRDGRGLLTGLTFSSGLQFQFQHDELGRTLRWEASDGTYCDFVYDKAGRCVRAENASGVLEFTFDAASQLVREKQIDLTIDYEYDVHGNLAARRNLLTGHRIELQYHPDGQVQSIRDGRGAFQEVSIDRRNRLTVRRFSNGVEEEILHNVFGEMQSQSVRTRAGTTLVTREYAYDSAGMLSEIRDSWRGATRYQYDAGARLVSARSNRLSEEYEYDPNDNVRKSTVLGPFSYSRGNRILKAGSTAFTHDDNGNVESIDDGRGVTRLSYDALGRVVRCVAPGGRVTEYAYDAVGRRVSKKSGDEVVRYYWHDYALMLETKNGSTVEYLIMPGNSFPFMMWRNGKVYHYLTDHLGTVQEILGPTGELLWQGRFSAWGQLVETSVARVENNLRFPGQYWDSESRLHYNLNRHYDPRSGRYLSPDPVGVAGGLNLYRYCTNPIMQSDALGLRVPSSPNTEITNQHNNGEFGTRCAACGVNTHGPGRQRPSSPDHVVPYADIENLPGYDQLTPENKARIQNDPDNFVSLCRPCNQSRQNKHYGDWEGHPDHPSSPAARAALAERQDIMKGVLAGRIQDMLKEQEDEARAARSPRCG